MSKGPIVVRPVTTGGALPRVTVLVPCYNYGGFLSHAVESALSQVDVDVDVVVVDDASSDDSAQIGAILASKNERVRLVRHERNWGHVETYNHALTFATGEYVVKLDADDLLTEGALSRSTSLMRCYGEVAFCYGYPIAFSGVEPPVPRSGPAKSWTIWHGHDWVRRVLRRGHNVIMQPEVLVRTAAIRDAGGYRERLRWAEDYNLWLRLATNGAVGRINGASQGLYRVHSSSLQRSADDIEVEDLKARVEAVALYFEELEGHAAGDLNAIAFQSLLRDARRLKASVSERSFGHRSAIDTVGAVEADLESRLARPARRTLSAHNSFLGRHYRALEWKLRFRRWRRTGV